MENVSEMCFGRFRIFHQELLSLVSTDSLIWNSRTNNMEIRKLNNNIKCNVKNILKTSASQISGLLTNYFLKILSERHVQFLQQTISVEYFFFYSYVVYVVM